MASRFLSIALLVACITACGQKGPLYMPAKAPATPADASSVDAAAAATEAAPLVDATKKEEKAEEKKDEARPAATPNSTTSPQSVAPAAH